MNEMSWTEGFRRKLDLLETADDLTPEQKMQARGLLNALATKVGAANVENFVGIWGWGFILPLLSWQVHAIEKIEPCSGGPKLIEKIFKGHAPDGALIMETGCRFMQEGIQVHIEPTLKLGSKEKRPDLLLKSEDGTNLCWLEIASSAGSQSERNSETFQRVIENLLFPFSQRSGEISHILSEHEIHELSQKLESPKALLAASDKCQLIEKAGSYRFVVSSFAGRNAHEESCRRWHVRPNQFTFPGFEPREEIRLLRQLKKEVRHFLNNEPSFVILEAQSLMELVDKVTRFHTLRSTLKPWIEQQPNLVGVVISLRCIFPQEEKVQPLDGDYLIEQSAHDFWRFDHVLLFNSKFRSPIGVDLKNIILHAYQRSF